MGLRNTTPRVRRIVAGVATVAVVLTLSGCGGFIGRSQATELADMNVSSPDLRQGEPLPGEYSCEGKQGSPPLRWSSAPLPKAKSVAIVVDGQTPSESAVQWVLYNIPATTTELGPNAAANPPEGSSQARVTSGKVGYQPPCVKKGSYRFSVYTLNGKVTVPEGAPLSDILKMIADQTIARGRLTAVDIE
jgi:phosphatidylethanolamine-binding protein (PEBP) family uncharacterized protein